MKYIIFFLGILAFVTLAKICRELYLRFIDKTADKFENLFKK